MNKAAKTSVQYLTIPEDFAGQRIDNFLVTRLKGVPKTHIYRILRKGEVRVNKKRISPDYRLQADDLVRLPPLQLEAKLITAKPHSRMIALFHDRILYEDKGLLIINKPAGIPVHGGTKTKMGIIEIFRAIYPTIPQLELVHRLDLDTSGCLILAKKRSVLREMHELLRAGKMHKVYLALTKGQWKKNEFKVEVPLRKNFLSSGERIVKVDTEGKAALTIFEPIQTVGPAMLVEATLHTGRTHQIRVHAQYRGHPIAGDEKYGDRDFNKQMRAKGLKRLFLHAHLIEFTLPSANNPIKVVAPLEDDLSKFLRQF